MAGEVFFNNGINYVSGGNDVLDSLITDIIAEIDLQQDYAVARTLLGFTPTKALSPEQKFSSMGGPVEIDQISENGLKPEGERTKNPDKGFEIIEYGEKFTTSFLMKQWLDKTMPLQDADSSVKTEWLALYNNAKYLLEGAMMRQVIEMIKVLYYGFVVNTVNGAGSPTPKGNTLFATNHSVAQGTKTFRNIGTTQNQPLANASLQDSLNIMKKTLLENGYRTQQPDVWKLLVGTDLATTARILLNTPGSQAGMFAGTGTNANLLNQFNFMGNKVEIVEVPMFGNTDKNGDYIGLPTMRFLINENYLKRSKALRHVELYPPILKTYENKETDAYIIDIRTGFAVDHYSAEAGIFGSLGNNKSLGDPTILLP